MEVTEVNSRPIGSPEWTQACFQLSLAAWFVYLNSPRPLEKPVLKLHFFFITIGLFFSPSSSCTCRLVLRARNPPSLAPGLEASGEGGRWGRGPEAAVAVLAAAAEALAEAAR